MLKNFVRFDVFETLAIMAVLTLAGMLAAGRGYPRRRLMLGWNWLLLISFSVCVITGFALLAPLQKPLARLLFRVHIWTGVICGWAGLYHAFQRMRALLPGRRRAARQHKSARQGLAAYFPGPDRNDSSQPAKPCRAPAAAISERVPGLP